MARSGSSPGTAGADAWGNRTCTLLTPYELQLLSNLRPAAVEEEGQGGQSGGENILFRSMDSATHLRE